MLSREERKALRNEARIIWREFNGYDGVVPDDARRDAIMQRYQEINTRLQQERGSLESEVQAIQHELAQLTGSEPEQEARRQELIEKHEELDSVLQKRAKRFDTDTSESIIDVTEDSPTLAVDVPPVEEVPAIADFPPLGDVEDDDDDEDDDELPPVSDFPPLDGTEEELPPISDFPPMDAADATPALGSISSLDSDSDASNEGIAVPDALEPQAIVEEIDSETDADSEEEESVTGIASISLSDVLGDDDDASKPITDIEKVEEEEYILPALNEVAVEEEAPTPAQQATQAMDINASPENIQPIIAEDNDEEEDLGSLPPLSDFVSDFSAAGSDSPNQPDFNNDPLLNITSLGDENDDQADTDKNPPPFGPPPVD